MLVAGGGRFRELDGLRGLAALAVVASHYTGSYNAPYPSDPNSFFDAWWGGYGVQLFFLISGFVILFSARRIRVPFDFVSSRLSRLYPAYWISLLIAVVVGASIAMPLVPLSPPVIAANLTMIQRWFLVPNVNDVYWTLAVEMQFYVLLFLALVLTQCRLTDRQVRIGAVSWSFIGLVISFWVMPVAHGLASASVATPVKLVLNMTLAEFAPLFATGALASLARRDGRVSRLSLMTATIAVVNAYLLHSALAAGIIAGICALFLVVVAVPRVPALTIAPVQWLGKVSYSLYLTHSLVGYLVIRLTWPYVGRDVAMLLALVVALVVAWVVWRVGEVTLSRMLRNWLDRMRDVWAARKARAVASDPVPD
ncbi:acyltransferase family protein [Microbacterium bovistercoris]|nr:acyltransferase [Microbacterium bovistercoris]